MPRKAILTAFLDAVWGHGDTSCLARYIAERYCIENDPGDPWHGQTLDRDGFAHRLVTSRAVAPDQRFTPVHMLEDGDQIAVAWRWTGTHLGDLPGMPASGKPLTMTGLTLYRFDADNRLCGHWQVADRLGIYQQLSGRA